MSESPMYPVSEQWKETAWINQDRYQAMYQQSIENPDQFWAEQAAKFLQWETPWQTVCLPSIYPVISMIATFLPPSLNTIYPR